MVASPFHPESIPEVPLHHALFTECQKYGPKDALVDAKTGKTYTYDQLLGHIRAFACGLHGLGVRKGDVVAIFSTNTIDLPVWFFGVMSAGGIVTTANPHYTKYELRYHVKDSDAKFIITSPSNLDTVNEVAKTLKDQVRGVICEAPGCITPSSLLASPTDAWPQLLSIPFNVKEDVATLPYSSGTTGLPKGVMITHYNIVANLTQLGHPGMFPKALLPQDSVVMAVIPFYHVYGMVGVLMLALSSGYKLVVMEKFQPRDFLATIEKYKVQNLPVVPSLLVFLTKSELVKEYDLSSLTTVSFGAAPLSAEADAEFQQRFPAIPNVRQGFGMTETTVSALNQGLTRPIKPGSVGYGIPNTEAKVIDVETGSLLGPNKRGELCIRGPQIMKGYWKRPEATKNTIDEFGFLHTGDIAYYDNDGYFYIVDRIKELIKCKGLQVAPAELEAVLLTHPKVADVGVTGIPHPTSGEVPRAYVVLKPKQTTTAEELKTFVKERVSSYKWLEGGLVFLPEIPRSPSGKILRRTLKEMAKSKL